MIKRLKYWLFLSNFRYNKRWRIVEKYDEMLDRDIPHLEYVDELMFDYRDVIKESSGNFYIHPLLLDYLKSLNIKYNLMPQDSLQAYYNELEVHFTTKAVKASTGYYDNGVKDGWKLFKTISEKYILNKM